MESTACSPQAVAQAFVRAVNRQDTEAIAALISPDHRFIDSLGNKTERRDAVRRAWAGYFGLVPDYALAIEETYSDGLAVVLLGMAHGTYAPDGQLLLGTRWQTPVAIRAYVEEGALAEWRVYADNEPIRRLMIKAR